MAAGYKEIEVQYIKTAFETHKNKPWYEEMLEKSDGVAQLVKNTETEGFYHIQSLPSLRDSSAPAFSHLKGKQSGSRTYAFLYHIAASLAEYARDSKDISIQKEMARLIAELHTAFHTQLIGGWTGILPIWANITKLKNTFLGDPTDLIHPGVFSDLGSLLEKLVADKTRIDSNLDKLLVSLYLCIKCIRLSAEGAPVGVAQEDFGKIDSLLRTIEECHRNFLENKIAKKKEFIAKELGEEKEPASEEDSSREEEKYVLEEKESKNETWLQEKKEDRIIKLFFDLVSSLGDLEQDEKISQGLLQIKKDILIEVNKIEQIEIEYEARDDKKDPLDIMLESIEKIELSIVMLRSLLSDLNDPEAMKKLDEISRAIYLSLFNDMAENFEEAKKIILFLSTFDPEKAELPRDLDINASKKEESVFEEEIPSQSDIAMETSVKEPFCVDPANENERENYILLQDAASLSSGPSSVKVSGHDLSLKFSEQRKIDWFFCELKEPKNPLGFTYKECIGNLRKLYIALCKGEINELEQFKNDCNRIIDEALRVNHGFSESSLIKLKEDFNRLFSQQSVVTSSTFFRSHIIGFDFSGRSDQNSMSRK